MKPLKTMKWLIRREFWEHKGMFLWAPVILSGALILLCSLLAIYSGGHTVDIDKLTHAHTQAMVIGVGKTLANTYMAAAMPLFMMLGVIVFFYCLSAMFEERRDRSILFWKSLPVSDQTTVLSKVAMALLVAPLITIILGIATSLILLLIVCIGAGLQGINLFGVLWLSPDVYLTPLRVVAMLPVYILWAIPTVGWLLMVSAWARSKVFLWAVGAPILSLIVAKMADSMFKLNLDVGWISHNIVARILGGLFPGAWIMFDDHSREAMIVQQLQSAGGEEALAHSMGNMLTQSWMSLGHATVWIGVAAGAAMIYAAARLRRWRDEG